MADCCCPINCIGYCPCAPPPAVPCAPLAQPSSPTTLVYLPMIAQAPCPSICPCPCFCDSNGNGQKCIGNGNTNKC